MSVRARHTPGHRLVAALALVVLTCASTAIAWALPCAGDCPAMSDAVQDPGHPPGHGPGHIEASAPPTQADAHSCCPQEPPADDDPKIAAPDCCGGDFALACERSVLVSRTDTSRAHQRALAIAAPLAARPLAVASLERLPLKLPMRRSAAPPGERLTTATVVLLI